MHLHIHLQILMWLYCSGHAVIKGNDRTATLACKAAIKRRLLLGRSEVLRSLIHCMRERCQAYHTIDHLEERDVGRGSSRRPSLKGRERAIVSQTNIGAISQVTLEKRLEDGVECIWAFLIV